jgi:RimJ/RimL family protein N-acetyltransferase
MMESYIENSRLVIKKYAKTDDAELLEFLLKNKNHLGEVLEEDEKLAQTLDDVRKIIKRKELGWLIKTFLTYGIWLKAENKYVGQVMIFKINWNMGRAEIGYYIDENYQGLGIVTESVSLCIDYMFGNTDIRELELYTKLTNLQSQKVATKCGFSKIGEERQMIKFNLTKNS